ncbi:MAG: hypothetical protein ACLGI7_09590 [Gammaproteobacteria bacterium]
MLPVTEPAVALSLVAAGCFFMAGLLTGVWKYAAIAASADAQAPAYVDIAHRAALLYSFAALLIAVFAAHSAWDDTTDFWAALLPLAFFAQAIVLYIVHGLLRDTDNQFRRPYRLGSMSLPGAVVHGTMWALVVAEIGGFAVLFAGVVAGLSGH